MTEQRRSVASSAPGQKDKIKVSVRVRPLNSREQGCKIVWKISAENIDELKDDGVTPTGTNNFTFDYVFSPEMDTAEVYRLQCSDIVVGCMEGYNGTIFAYGQTSSGKTHTLLGDPDANPGVSILAFNAVFDEIKRRADSESTVNVTYLEIYNEGITDLLQEDKDAGIHLKIFQDKLLGPRVQGACERRVESTKDCMALLLAGEKKRSYAATGMNDKSSRSHTMLQLRIVCEPAAGDDHQAESSRNMRRIAEKFQAMQKHLQAERATFYVVDHDTRQLHSAAGEIIISLPMSSGLAGACASTAQTILIDDVYQDQRFNREHDKKTGFRSRSMCIVPIKGAGSSQVHAVAQFLNKANDAVFDSCDRVKAEEFAAEAAPFLAAARAVARVSSTCLLNLVDLAGSERVQKTGATGSTLKEAGHINKSLMTLGACILALSEGKLGHIPFRDSKLTWLLGNSLGGNSRTAVICAISPASRNRSETVSTLQFANRAKKIVNKVQQNQHKDTKELASQYMKEVNELKDYFRSEQQKSKWRIAGLKAALSAKQTKKFQMDDALKAQLLQLKRHVAQAEAIANALILPGSGLRISLCPMVTANADDLEELRLAVKVTLMPRSTVGTDPLKIKMISGEDFRLRLALLLALQANHEPGSVPVEDVWRAFSQKDKVAAALANFGISPTNVALSLPEEQGLHRPPEPHPVQESVDGALLDEADMYFPEGGASLSGPPSPLFPHSGPASPVFAQSEHLQDVMRRASNFIHGIQSQLSQRRPSSPGRRGTELLMRHSETDKTLKKRYMDLIRKTTF